jgi:hypothetical protein
MRTRRLLVVLALPMALVSACGGDSTSTAADPAPTTAPASTSEASLDPSPTEAAGTPAPAGTKSCASVWRVGNQIPRSYKGCAQDGALLVADNLPCSSGQTLVRYDEQYFGVAGGTIFRADKLNRDRRYLDMVASCRG